MAIIIRETKTLPNGVQTTVKRYVSDFSPLTGDLRKKAEEYDELIQSKVKQIEDEIEQMSLFELRGRPNVLKLWYEFGRRLSFIDDLQLSPTALKFIWRAIYDHSTRLYKDKGQLPTRLERAPTTSNLCYSHIIGKLDWEFVDSAGNWTAWVEFLDSEVMRNDNRIINWIKKLQNKGPLQGGFLRVLNRTIRRRLSGIETLRLSEQELEQILEETFQDAIDESE